MGFFTFCENSLGLSKICPHLWPHSALAPGGKELPWFLAADDDQNLQLGKAEARTPRHGLKKDAVAACCCSQLQEKGSLSVLVAWWLVTR